MSSHNRRNTLNSRIIRPRAISRTLSPSFVESRSAPHRVTRPRSQTNPTIHRLSERQQQALFEAAIASSTLQIPTYYPETTSLGDLGDSSVDPNSLALSPTTTAVHTPSVVPSICIDQPRVSLEPQGRREEVEFPLDVVEQNMSVATYMLPSFGHAMDSHYTGYTSQYNTGSIYNHDEQSQVPHTSPPSSTYATSYTTSPALMSTSPRIGHVHSHEDGLRSQVHRSSYASSYASAAHSPFLTAAASPAQSQYHFTSSPASHIQYPHRQSPALTSHDVATGYSTSYTIPSQHYSSTGYETLPAPSVPSSYPSASTATWPLPSTLHAATESGESSVRVLNSRPKPQCWDHGCNGRQFSTFSNLLRHQREKSGTAAKSQCPRCGAEFTRTTARNGHMAHDKCKRRSLSEARDT